MTQKHKEDIRAIRDSMLPILKKWKGNWPSWFVSKSDHPAWLRKQTKACLKQIRDEEEFIIDIWQEPIQRVINQTLSEWESILSPMPHPESWASLVTSDWVYRYMESIRKEVQRLSRRAKRSHYPETKIRDEIRSIINKRIRALPYFLPYLLHEVKQRTVFRLMEINQIEYKEWHTVSCSSPFCSVLAYQRRERNAAFFVEGELVRLGDQALRISRPILHPPLHLMCRCEIVPVLS
jgi:hypothetical protein